MNEINTGDYKNWIVTTFTLDPFFLRVIFQKCYFSESGTSDKTLTERGFGGGGGGGRTGLDGVKSENH